MRSRRLRAAVFVCLALLLMIFPCACSAQGNNSYKAEADAATETDAEKNISVTWSGLEPDGSLALQYAEQFSVDYYEGGYALITIADSDRYLVVPEQMPVPEGLDADIVVLQQPLNHIYLAASSAMDLVRVLDGIDAVRFTGTEAEDWYIEEARKAVSEGSMLFAGKYSAPDFEMLLGGNCNLAVESTMIYHKPEIKEQLEEVGIPVLVERSSYESHPLGRMEWIKLYGVLLDKEAEAEEYFAGQADALSDAVTGESTGKTVVFFYITSNGSVNVRKSEDYVAKMIALAGGEYVSWDEESDEENALSTMTIQMEAFYDKAKDADVLIYNSTIDGELYTVEELLQKSELLSDFKAVQNGNVWCIGRNMFQESTGCGDMILDIHKILSNEVIGDADLKYLHRLR